MADLLSAGSGVGEAAASIEKTPETARFYVKRVLVKTGTYRQSELMRLRLALPGQPEVG